VQRAFAAAPPGEIETARVLLARLADALSVER
jgi:hypothetical protein